MLKNKIFKMPVAKFSLGNQKKGKVSHKKYRSYITKKFFGFNIARFEDGLKKLSKKKLQYLADKRALSTFKMASQRVPAYKDFLNKHRIDAHRINQIKDLSSIPVTNKENYIYHYPLAMRLWDGEINGYSAVAVSSGTSGKTILWPRDLITEYESGYLHEYLMHHLFQTKSKSTLGIVAFHMGMYTAGVLTFSSLQLVSEKGYPLLVVSPGMNIKDIVSSIDELYQIVDQVVIFIYPSLVKDVLDALEGKNYNLPAIKMHIVPAGEPFTEEWRQNIAHRLSDKNHQAKIFSIYGCSEKTILGHETSLTEKMRFNLNNNKALLKQLNYEISPNLYQYYPFLRYFESVNDRLLLTASGGTPIIRYDIGDKGKLLSFEQAQTIWKSSDCDQDHFVDAARLPFIFVQGRGEAIIFYGANIYQANVHAGVENEVIKPWLTGRFTLEKKELNDEESLFIHLELKENITLKSLIKNKIERIIIQTLQKLNAEHKVVVEALGKKAVPTIVIHRYSSPPHFAFKGKHRWIV
jgi:phenylacetate-CoA ligase